MQQIPIRINRKGTNFNQVAFKIFPIQKKLLFSRRRQKASDSMQKKNDDICNERKHGTLDSQRPKGENRYRRISSSNGAQKFPKDFFSHNEISKTPIRIRLSKGKRQPLQQSGAESRGRFHISQSQECKHYRKKYTLQSPERNCQKLTSQVQTPKFKLQNFEQEQSCETKSKTTNKKNKQAQYLSNKKQYFPTFFNESVTKEQDQTYKNKFDQMITQQSKDLQNDKENTILLQTLGKKENIMKQTTNQIKKRNRIQSHIDKENRHDAIEINTSKKSIRAFLSTKGLNLKIQQKINQMKCISGEQSKCFSLNLRQQKELWGLRMAKGLSQNIEYNQNLLTNTFRIRKIA